MLTPAQARVLAFLQTQLQHNGVCPSYREIARATGQKGPSNVHRLVAQLEERGYVRRLPCRARALEILRLLPSQCLPLQCLPPQYLPPQCLPPQCAEPAGSITLPLPPSASQLHVQLRNGRRARAKRYQKWLADGMILLRAAGCKPLPANTPYATEIIAPATMRCDLDNIAKPVHDLLRLAGLTPDDTWLTACSLRRDKRQKQSKFRASYAPADAL